jgi:hypothetical protein
LGKDYTDGSHQRLMAVDKYAQGFSYRKRDTTPRILHRCLAGIFQLCGCGCHLLPAEITSNPTDGVDPVDRILQLVRP